MVPCAIVLALLATNRSLADDQAADTKLQYATAWLQCTPPPGSTAQAEERFWATQLAKLQMPMALGTALKRIEDSTTESPARSIVRDQKDPVGWLQRQLRIARFNDSELILVSLALPDQLAAAQFVNAIVDVYLQNALQQPQAELAQRRAEAQARVAQLEKQLAANCQKLSLLQAELPGDSAETLRAQLQLLRQDRLATENRLLDLSLAAIQAPQPASGSADEHAIEEKLRQQQTEQAEALLQQLLEQRQGQILETESKLRHYLQAEWNPALILLRSEIAGLQDAIRQSQDELVTLQRQNSTPPTVRLLERPSEAAE
jgi:hypothetical protein